MSIGSGRKHRTPNRSAKSKHTGRKADKDGLSEKAIERRIKEACICADEAERTEQWVKKENKKEQFNINTPECDRLLGFIATQA